MQKKTLLTNIFKEREIIYIIPSSVDISSEMYTPAIGGNIAPEQPINALSSTRDFYQYRENY